MRTWQLISSETDPRNTSLTQSFATIKLIVFYCGHRNPNLSIQNFKPDKDGAGVRLGGSDGGDHRSQ